MLKREVDDSYKAAGERTRERGERACFQIEKRLLFIGQPVLDKVSFGNGRNEQTYYESGYR